MRFTAGGAALGVSGSGVARQGTACGEGAPVAGRTLQVVVGWRSHLLPHSHIEPAVRRAGHLKRANSEIAALELAAWAREHHKQTGFELRRVDVCGLGNLDVIYLVMKAREQ